MALSAVTSLNGPDQPHLELLFAWSSQETH